MPTLSSVTSFAANDPLSPSHFNSKFNVLVSNISLVNSALTTGSAGLGGSGTTGFVPLWSSAATLSNSSVSQVGTVLSVGGPLSVISHAIFYSSVTTATRGVIRLATGGDIFARTADNANNVALIGHDPSNNRVLVASSSTGAANITVGFNSDQVWITDGTYSIGAIGGNRPRRMFVSDHFTVGNNPGLGTKGAYIAGYRSDILAGRNDSNTSDIVLWGVTGANEVLQGANLDCADLVVRRPILQDYAEKVHAFGTISANTVASLTSGNVFTATATSNVSFQMSNAPASPNAGTATFWLTASGSTITFSFLSVGFGAQGTPPGIPNGTGMVVNTMTVDGGATYRGSYTTGYT